MKETVVLNQVASMQLCLAPGLPTNEAGPTIAKRVQHNHCLKNHAFLIFK
jgi:hypothetical protein